MTTYYVATTGNDSSGTGAIGSPWATLAKGLATVAVGSHVIQMRGGTYGSTYIKGRDTIIVENYPGENVIIQRTTSGTAVLLENCRNMTFRRHSSGGSFTVRSTLLGDGQNSGIQSFISGGGSGGFVPTNLTIDGLIVNNIAGWGIQAKDTSNVNITNCDIYNNATGVRFQRVTGSSYIQYSLIHHQNRMIRNTESPGDDDNGGTAIGLDDGTNGAIVQYNTLYENHAASFDYGIDGGCVEHFANSNCITQYNICYNNATFIETGTSNATTYPMLGNIVRRNLVYAKVNYSGGEPGIYHRAGDLRVENNTFDLDDGTGVIVLQGSGGGYAAPMHNTKIRNNILVSRNASTPCLQISNVTGITGLVIDYNLLYNSTGSGAVVVTANNYGGNKTGTQLAAWQAASPFSDHDVWNDDPDWVNRTIRNYNLLTGSPAINAGTPIAGTTDGYTGSAPDLGRFEFAVVPGNTTATAGHASGTGAAHAAKMNLKPSARLASGVGEARGATSTLVSSTTAGHASGTGAAHNPGVDNVTSVDAGHGAGTGAAHAATTTSIDQSTLAPATHASGTGQAINATITTSAYTSVPAGHASGTGSGYAASLSLKPSMGLAAGTGTAHAPSTSPITYVSAQHAAGTGAAFSITVNSVKPGAGHAAGTGAAANAAVLTAITAVSVYPQVSSGMGSAYAAQVTPPAPVITTPAADGYDYDGIVTIGGTAKPNVLIELFDGATSVGTVLTTSGAWSITLPGVTDGVHSYTAYATDSVGTVSTVSNTRLITVDATEPTVVETSPATVPGGVTIGVFIGSNITVEFSEAMDTTTITTSSFRVIRLSDRQQVAGSITYSAGDTIATFDPSSNLAAQTRYRVILDNTIRDVAGNPLVPA